METAVAARGRLVALLFTASLLGGIAPLASPAAAAAVVLPPPTLTAPTSGDTIYGNPVFAWTAVSSAVKYRVEVSTDSSFSPLVSGFPVETQNLRFAAPAELPLGSLYWRVAALDAGSAVGTFALDSFTKNATAAPNIVSPDDAAAFTFPTDPLLFTWDPLAGAQSYELQVDDADDFIGATTYTTKNTSYVVTEPRTVGQVFHWRVRGVLGSVYSDWSTDRTFSSAWPGTPTLDYPAANATGVADVYFAWDPVLGAKTYQLQLSPNGNWANNRTIDVTVKSTRYAPLTPLNNGNYYWRVRALDAAGTQNYGPWSDLDGVPGDERVFQRGWSNTPSQTGPADTASTATPNALDATWQNPTFSWTSVRHASWYRIRFSTTVDSSSGTPQLNGSIKGCLTNRTTFTPYGAASGIALLNPGGCDITDTSYLLDGSTYYWEVAALDDPVLNQGFDIWGPPRQDSSIVGLRSPVQSFTYAAPVPPLGSVRQLLPADYLTPVKCDPALGCTTSEADTPTLSWNAIPGAAGYTITVALDPNFTNVYRSYTTGFNRLAPRDSWRDNQANQAYYWNVTPIGLALDTSNRSVFQKHTAPIQRTADAAELANDFTMAWEDYWDTNQALTPAIPQESNEYRIQVSTVSDFATTIDTRVVNTPFYTPFDRTYPEGPIYWRVQAIDGSNNDLTMSSDVNGFATKKSPAPALVYPAEAVQVQGVPYLQWVPLAYAASYDVQIDNDANFSSPITTTTKMTAWAYTESLSANTTYYWRVRRSDADDRDGAWSASRSFTVVPTAPTLVSPANGGNPAPTTLLLQWTAAQPSPKYGVDLSTSSTFGTQLSGFPQTTVMSSWAPKTLLTNGTYYWRVRALNAAGTTVAMSDTFHFAIDSTRPSVTVLSPATAAGITSPFTVTFSEAVTGVDATSFKLTVAGTSSPLAGTVTTLSPTQARFTPAASLVPGQTYSVALSSTITDIGGNPLLPYSANVRTSTIVQESSPAVHESWGRWTVASASGGSMKMSDKVSSKVVFTFTGTSIGLVGYRGTLGGYASVFLDGVLQSSSVSSYAASGRYGVTLWSKVGLAAGQHTLQVIPKGTKPSASKGTWVYVDAFTTDGGTVQDNAAAVVDAFRRVSTASAYGSAYDLIDHAAATGRSGAALSFQFKGTGVTWYGTKGPKCGKAYVYIDNVRKVTVDLYRSSTAYKQKLWASSTLANGLHTFRIVVVGSKRTASKGYDVSFDYATVR